MAGVNMATSLLRMRFWRLSQKGSPANRAPSYVTNYFLRLVRHRAMLVYQPLTHPPDANVSSLERAATATSKRRSVAEVNIGKFLLRTPVSGMEA